MQGDYFWHVLSKFDPVNIDKINEVEPCLGTRCHTKNATVSQGYKTQRPREDVFTSTGTCPFLESTKDLAFPSKTSRGGLCFQRYGISTYACTFMHIHQRDHAIAAPTELAVYYSRVLAELNFCVPSQLFGPEFTWEGNMGKMEAFAVDC